MPAESHLTRRALPVTCASGHSFKIDPVGLGTATVIECPECGDTGRLPAPVIGRIRQEWKKATKGNPAARRELLAADQLPKARVVD